MYERNFRKIFLQVLIFQCCVFYCDVKAEISDQSNNTDNTVERFVTTVNEDDVIFKYYNQENVKEGTRVYPSNLTEKMLRGWRLATQTKVITHGWLSSDQSGAVEEIKNAYLKMQDINIITVDWSDPASWKAYPLPAYLTKQVGGFSGKLIDEMVKKKLVTLDKVHVIGHSLGSHVAGSTGAAVTTGKVSRITGLDPAGPAFEYMNIVNSALGDADAEFIDIIHTAGKAAGYYGALGHADFYPNGGTPPQPGCFEGSSVSGWVNSFSCSHSRAYQFFTDSILHPHSYKAYKCGTWVEFSEGTCANGEVVYMGDETPHTARGYYYLSTKKSPPYRMGDFVPGNVTKAV